METELEHLLVSSSNDEMITYLIAHPEYFEEAIELAISDKQPYSCRAAGLMWRVMDENDQRVQKYIKDIIKTLTTKNESHQRELIKVLQYMVISEEYESYLLDICITIWKKITSPPSVRFNAFKMIVKIAKGHPDLTNEIELLTQNQYMELLSSSTQNSIFKMFGEIKPKKNTGDNTLQK